MKSRPHQLTERRRLTTSRYKHLEAFHEISVTLSTDSILHISQNSRRVCDHTKILGVKRAAELKMDKFYNYRTTSRIVRMFIRKRKQQDMCPVPYGVESKMVANLTKRNHLHFSRPFDHGACPLYATETTLASGQRSPQCLPKPSQNDGIPCLKNCSRNLNSLELLQLTSQRVLNTWKRGKKGTSNTSILENGDETRQSSPEEGLLHDH